MEAKAKDIPVAFLDPQVMSLDSIKFDRHKVLQYVQKAFTKYTKKDYIMSEYSGFLPILSLIDLDNIESHCKSPAS